MSKPNPKTHQPRRSSRPSLRPNRFGDEHAIRKKSTQSKPKPKKPTRSKPKTQKSRLNFFGSNSSDDDSVRIVLEDRDPKYTPKPATEPRSRRHKSIGPRVNIGSRDLNAFQLANMRAKLKKQRDVLDKNVDELTNQFDGLQPPGFN